MLSKNKIKYIRSLELKKKRKEEQVFVAEGHKLVGDLLGYFPCKLLIATSNWLKINHPVTANEIIEVTQEELSRASLQKTPQEVLAVFVQPSYDLNPEVIKSSLCLALDDVQDPGNLGTIIRTADAFALDGIILCEGCVDPTSPKVVRATMGAAFRMPIAASSLEQTVAFLREQNMPLYAAALSESSVPLTHVDLTRAAVMIGNEGRGITKKAAALCTQQIIIPMDGRAESLNASVAASIIMYEMSRKV